MTMRRWLASLVAAVAVAVPAGAQQTPEEVAQSYFQAFAAQDLERVVALTHPRALESFRASLLELVGQEDLSVSPFAGREDLATMPADSFYLVFMDEGGNEEAYNEMFGSLEIHPVGHVLQGDSLAHVVYNGRMAFMEQQQQTMVLTLRRHTGGWRVDPGDGMLDMIGGGTWMLLMSASMQAAISGGGMDMGFGVEMGGGHDHDDFEDEEDHDHGDSEDEDHDHDGDDEDEDDDADEDDDDDDPPPL